MFCLLALRASKRTACLLFYTSVHFQMLVLPIGIWGHSFVAWLRKKKNLFFPENRLIMRKKKKFWLSLTLATNTVRERTCVAQPHGTIKWESVKEYLHLSTNLFPNNKAAFQLHLWLVSFLDLNLNDCHSITQNMFHGVWQWMFELLVYIMNCDYCEDTDTLDFKQCGDTLKKVICVFVLCTNNH